MFVCYILLKGYYQIEFYCFKVFGGESDQPKIDVRL